MGSLSDSWMMMYYLYHPGTYTICHRPAPNSLAPRPEWQEQAKVHLLEPNAYHCSQLRNASSVHGYASCALNQTNSTMQLFDGFFNNKSMPWLDRCTFDCNECLDMGGDCRCHGSTCDV